MKNLTSVILPAYNEEAVIGRALRQLKNLEAIMPLQIIVACNGCTDRTAEVARSFSVDVIEIMEAGKTRALNEACARARGNVVVLMDADLIVSPAGVYNLVKTIDHESCQLAVGSMEVDTSGSSALVSSFYRGWLINPYFNEGKVGGIYAISRKTLMSFLPFPKLTNDDEWIRRKVPENCSRHVPTCVFVAQAPRTLRDLLKVRMRVLRGNKELKALGLAVPLYQARQYSRQLLFRLLDEPAVIPHFLSYSLISLWLRIRFQLGWYSNEWGRDESTRVALEA